MFNRTALQWLFSAIEKKKMNANFAHYAGMITCIEGENFLIVLFCAIRRKISKRRMVGVSSLYITS
jgi:hypothetical protein